MAIFPSQELSRQAASVRSRCSPPTKSFSDRHWCSRRRTSTTTTSSIFLARALPLYGASGPSIEEGALESTAKRAYEVLTESLAARGIEIEAVERRLRAQRVETPSWGYGDTGTRFAVFPQTGVPRDPFEKLADAAQVHGLTGVCPSVAIHIPWDKVNDYGELKEHAESLGLRIGAVNPNLFQEPAYKLGSVSNPDPAVHRSATDRLLECVEIADETASDVLSLWFADGTNYAGQDSFTERRHRMIEALGEVYAAMPEIG